MINRCFRRSQPPSDSLADIRRSKFHALLLLGEGRNSDAMVLLRARSTRHKDYASHYVVLHAAIDNYHVRHC